jgi:hypothetical protein
MPYFEVIVECPVHRRPLYIKVRAGDPELAKKKVLDITINCPYYPTHKFVVGKREGEKEVLGVYPLKWLPAEEEGIVSVAPSYETIPAVPATPLETMYYINPDVAERQLGKSDWWSK